MTDDPPTTLVVRLEETDEFFDQLHADVEAMEDGEQPEHPHSLSVPDLEALEDIFTKRNLELVRAIRHHEPESMRAAARLVDRDIKNVSTALNRLAELGLVEIEQDGRSKRPVMVLLRPPTVSGRTAIHGGRERDHYPHRRTIATPATARSRNDSRVIVSN